VGIPACPPAGTGPRRQKKLLRQPSFFMRLLTPFLFLLSTLSWHCNRNHVEIAPEITYYVEITCGAQTPECLQLKQYLEDNIPRYKYTITNESGYVWPFYQAFEKDVPVPAASLMIPHWQIHHMELKKKGKQLKEGEVLLQIDLYSASDTLPDFNVTISKIKDSKLSLSAKTGIQNFYSFHQDSTLTTQDIILKSVIRYSFK